MSGPGQVAGGGGQRGREKCEISEIRHLDNTHETGLVVATNRVELKLMMRD